MKKKISVLLAAAIIVTVAGCSNKAEPAPQTSESEEQAASSSAPEEETRSVRVTDANRETVIVTDADGVSHVAVTNYSKVTQYTTRAPSPSRLTQRPTAEPTTPASTRPSTTALRTTRPTTERTTDNKPEATTPKATSPLQEVTTVPTFVEPDVAYGGTLGTQEDSVRIRSHSVELTQNNSLMLTLTIDILACSGTSKYIYIGYDCYDSAGNKLNDETVKCIVPVRQDQTQTVSVATVPLGTAKVVFKNI